MSMSTKQHFWQCAAYHILLLYTDNNWEVMYHRIFFLLCVFSNAVGCKADDESKLLWWQFWLKHNGIAHCRHNIMATSFCMSSLMSSCMYYTWSPVTILWEILWYSPVEISPVFWSLCYDLCATVVLNLALWMRAPLSLEWLWTILATTVIILMGFDLPHIFSSSLHKDQRQYKIWHFHSNVPKFWLWSILVTTNNARAAKLKVRVVGG